MGMKTLIKRMGRFMFSLKQEDDSIITQSILIVDNGYSRPADLRLAIKKIQDCYWGAKISVLTLAPRSSFWKHEFSGLEVIVCSQQLVPNRYRLAWKMLFLRKKDFDRVVIFSLDISPLIVALTLFKSRVVLYNQWGQWCSLRLKQAGDIFRVTYNPVRVKSTLKGFLKKIGLFFVLLVPEDPQALSHSILIISDGILPGQLIYAARRIKEHLPGARIEVLTAGKCKEAEEEQTISKIIRADKFLINKYRIAWQMFKLGKNNYDYVVLPSLDVTPLVASVLFMHTKVLLNNQWHQWWSLRLKPPRYYFLLFPRLILSLIFRLVTLAYLLINVSWIFLMRLFNGFKINLLSERD